MARVNAFMQAMFRCPGCGEKHEHSFIQSQRPPFAWSCGYCRFECTVTASWNGGFSYENSKPGARG